MKLILPLVFILYALLIIKAESSGIRLMLHNSTSTQSTPLQSTTSMTEEETSTTTEQPAETLKTEYPQFQGFSFAELLFLKRAYLNRFIEINDYIDAIILSQA